jgi:hypothetical protein
MHITWRDDPHPPMGKLEFLGYKVVSEGVFFIICCTTVETFAVEDPPTTPPLETTLLIVSFSVVGF